MGDLVALGQAPQGIKSVRAQLKVSPVGKWDVYAGSTAPCDVLDLYLCVLDRVGTQYLDASGDS